MKRNLPDSSLRYVRWYKGKNAPPAKSWARLSITTLRSRLRGRRSPRSPKPSAKVLLSPMLSMDDEGNDGIEVLSINSSSCGGGNIQWHSLKDATGIELCLESPPNHDDAWQGHAES